MNQKNEKFDKRIFKKSPEELELVLSLKKEKVLILENKSTRIRNTEIVLNMALSSKWTRRLASQAGNVGSIPARVTS